MAHILFTWELGEGLGHLRPIQHAAALLIERGHAVTVAARDLRHTDNLFSDGIQLLPAAHLQSPVDTPISPAWSFSQLLHNCGFAHAKYLRPLVTAWQNIFRLCQPDVVVFDHSPTALFAASAFPFAKLMSGSGFMCPPPGVPFGVFSPDTLTAQCAASIDDCERQLREVVNSVGQGLGCRPVNHISEIYSDCKQLLTTVPVLDHFGARGDGNYAGINPIAPGGAPQWPEQPGKRIFCYLKPFERLPALVHALAMAAQPVIFFGARQQDFAAIDTPNIRFSTQPVDLNLVSEDCDFAILNGNHDSCAQLLSLGVAVLNIPLFREQQLFCQRAQATGACLTADVDDLDDIIAKMNRMVTEPGFREQAKAFAASNSGIPNSNPLVNAIETLLND